MFKLSKMLITILLTIFITSGILGSIYFFFGRDKVATAQESSTKVSTSLSQQALTTDAVLKKLKKQAVLYGYKGEIEYTYTHQDTFDYLLKKGKEGFWEGLWKDTLRFFVNREYKLDLYAEYDLGYDLSEIKPDDIEIDEKKGSMIIYAPQLKMNFVPKFPGDALDTLKEEDKKAKKALDKLGDENKKEEKEEKSTKTDSELGMFREPFTENDRTAITGAAIRVGKEKVLQDEETIQEGYDDTNEALRNLLMQVPGAKKVEIRIKK